MRPALLWAAAATVVATVVVSWLPDEQPLAIPAHARSQHAAEPQPGRDAPDASPVAPAATWVVPFSAPLSAPLSAPRSAPFIASIPANPSALPHREPWPRIQAAEQAAWTPPAPPGRAAPPSVATEAPPPPPPPTFAYQWLGQLVEDGRTRLFLAGPQGTEVHAIGDVLPTGWRIDGVQDGQLQLTWMATGATVNVAARP